MVVNRYTQLPQNAYTYNPRSLQELMIAPAYMREQHNALEENIAATETALAQIDNDQLHNPLVQAEQERLYNQLQQQADMLNKEGFNSSAKSNFLRFNKDYQNSIGPKGILGQAQEYSAEYLKKRENTIANAINAGHDPVASVRQLDEAYQKWADSFDGKKLTPFKDIVPPKYEDLTQDLKDIKAIHGSTITTDRGNESYNITPDPITGQYVVQTQSGQILTETNNKQLNQALEQLNQKWLTPEGTGYKSDQWNYISPEYRAQQIKTGLGIMEDFKQQDTRQNNYSFIKGAEISSDNKPINFLTDKIQGYNAYNIDPSSPILGLDQVNHVEYNDDGSINSENSRFKNYEEKVNYFKNQRGNLVSFNKALGLYTLTTMNNKTGNYSTVPIKKDANHYKKDIHELRKKSPYFDNMTDKEVIQLLHNYREDINANFVASIDPINSNYEFLNDKLFGNLKGSGEKGSGVVQNKGATINGQQLTSDEVAKELGYDNLSILKEKGHPVVQGYVAGLGKWQVAVKDNDGKYENMFVEAPDEINTLFEKTRLISENMLQAKPFSKIGSDKVQLKDGTEKTMTAYMINDYSGNPLLIYSEKDNINNPKELVEFIPSIKGGYRLKVKLENGETTEDANSRIVDYKTIFNYEKEYAATNPYYLEITGKKNKI